MENVLIYGTIFDMTDDMTNEEVGLLFNGINSWRKGEEVVFEDRYLKGIWKGILPNLEKLKDNYEKKVASNRKNGKKGGRPRKNVDTNNKPEEKTTKEVTNEESPMTPQDLKMYFSNHPEADELLSGDAVEMRKRINEYKTKTIEEVDNYIKEKLAI